MHNHYITIDENNVVVRAFSNAFIQPDLSTGSNDILILENTNKRHYNPGITDENGKYNYKWEDGIIPRTEEEKYPIEELKAKKVNEVDTHAQQKIAEGFVYDDLTFSLSQNAQMNWTNIRANKDLLAFPLPITTQDGTGEYLLTSESVDGFVGLAISTIKDILIRTRQIKQEILALENREDVYNYIIDFVS